MELVHNYQITLNELCTERIDYFIAASGYQKRSTFLAESFPSQDVKKLLLISDENYKPDLKLKNEQVFERLGFQSMSKKDADRYNIELLLTDICFEKPRKNLNILVDYSCMDKSSYATVVDFLLKNEPQAERINLFFSYTPKSINVLPSKTKWNSIDPIFAVKEREKKHNTISLVIGINSNSEPTTELIKNLKPSKIVVFIPDFSHDKEYYKEICRLNLNLIEQIPKENIFKYPAQRPDQISSMLTSVCLDLRLNSNVFVVPQGPKTFALASILLSIRYPDIILRENKFNERKPDDEGIAAGEPVIIKSVFCSEDEAEGY